MPTRTASSLPAFPAAMALLACAPLALGCYTVSEDDAGPTSLDGGTVDLSRDAGQPVVDSGPPPPPPPVDSGPNPGVDAGPPSVEILSFSADSETLAFLSGTTLRYNTANAQSCAIAPDIGTVELPSGTRFVEGGEPGTSVTYTLTCEGEDGPVSESVTLVTTLVEHEGNYSANTSAELSSLSGINVVTGDLYLQNMAGVTDLSVLDGLVRVDGNVFVLTNPALTTVNLPNLEEIGRALFVDGNPVLASFDLPLLGRIGERLYVSRNFALPQAGIDGLVSQVSAAEGIGGPVMDYYNDPADVVGTLDQVMLCAPDGENPEYELDFYTNGNVYAWGLAWDPATDYSLTGTYSRFEQHLEIEIPPQLGPGGTTFEGYEDTATTTELEYDRVTAVVFPGLLGACYLTGLPNTGLFTPRTYRCPTGGGPERIEVDVGTNGTAQWTNAPTSGTGTTIALPGAYVLDGDWMYFAFPASVRQEPAGPLRFPIARRGAGDESLDFIELPEGASPCPIE